MNRATQYLDSLSDPAQAEIAQLVDMMIQELLPPETYNNKFEIIEKYISSNVQKYVVDTEVNDEKKIFGGTYYGIDSAVKVNRQQVLVALQKDLKLINYSNF